MKTSVAHSSEGKRSKADQPSAETCPASNLPVLDDTDPTMPVLALSQDEKDFGYDPYDTGTFWAER
jgi:hypothetical protein